MPANSEPALPGPRERAGESPLRYQSVAEVAALMRVSKMTVYRLVHSGELPAVRVGRSFRVPLPAVRRYLDRDHHPRAAVGGTRTPESAPSDESGPTGG